MSRAFSSRILNSWKNFRLDQGFDRNIGHPIKVLVDEGCRFSSREVDAIWDVARIREIDKIEKVNIYDKRYDPSSCLNISRKAAMMEFYIITQKNEIVKNFDAVLYLYRHVNPTFYYVLRALYYPMDFIFRRFWLPHRFKLSARDDVQLELSDPDYHRNFMARKRRRKNR